MNIPGIYKISSKIKPSREYYGSSQDVFGRLKMHLRDLRRGKHHSLKLQYHYNKYGEADLIFQMVLGCDIIDLIKTEQYFLDSYKPYFNILPNAGSHLGAKRSPESCKKCSLAKSGKNHHYFGKHLTDEHKRSLSESLKGHPSYTKGTQASDETKKKMSIAHKGHLTSNETKNKISISNNGKKRSKEFCQQCSERNKSRLIIKGGKESDEFKQKYREREALKQLKKHEILCMN